MSARRVARVLINSPLPQLDRVFDSVLAVQHDGQTVNRFGKIRAPAERLAERPFGLVVFFLQEQHAVVAAKGGHHNAAFAIKRICQPQQPLELQNARPKRILAAEATGSN